MLTATIPHHRGDPLTDLITALAGAWRYVISGAPWQRRAERHGIVGQVRGLEATHGAHSWHPHVHVLLFARAPIGDAELAEFSAWVYERYARKVGAYYYDEDGRLACRHLGRNTVPEGFRPAFAVPHPEHGIQVHTKRDAGYYVAKLGLAKEATMLQAKAARGRNRTPWQILRDYHEHGRAADGVLWQEWCEVMTGRNHLVYSPGLKDRLDSLIGGDQLELTDLELAHLPEAEDARRVCTLAQGLWDTLARDCELLEAYVALHLEAGMAAAGCPQDPTPDPGGGLDVLRLALQALTTERVRWDPVGRSFYLGWV
jgi:hypothetical protein